MQVIVIVIVNASDGDSDNYSDNYCDTVIVTGTMLMIVIAINGEI